MVWEDFGFKKLFDYNMEGIFKDKNHQMNFSGGGTQFRGYFKKMLELVIHKITELPEAMKANINIDDLILKGPELNE